MLRLRIGSQVRFAHLKNVMSVDARFRSSAQGCALRLQILSRVAVAKLVVRLRTLLLKAF